MNPISSLAGFASWAAVFLLAWKFLFSSLEKKIRIFLELSGIAFDWLFTSDFRLSIALPLLVTHILPLDVSHTMIREGFSSLTAWAASSTRAISSLASFSPDFVDSRLIVLFKNRLFHLLLTSLVKSYITIHTTNWIFRTDFQSLSESSALQTS